MKFRDHLLVVQALAANVYAYAVAGIGALKNGAKRNV
jgi:hypothetical protein